MTTLHDLDGSTWTGDSELWMDPAGNEALVSPCTLVVDGDVVRYTWSFKGQDKRGSVALSGAGGAFTDTFHSAEPMSMTQVPNDWGLFNLAGTYPAVDGSPDWGWRVALSLRTPTGQLVLQMTNITPWGEDGRAVRMVFSRDA